jgi:hypothetical protein
MAIGGSIVLIALGAILRWGVTARVSQLDIPTVGLILMVVGAIGLLLGLLIAAVPRHLHRT